MLRVNNHSIPEDQNPHFVILRHCLSGVAESDLVEGVTELGGSTTPQEQPLPVDGSSTAVLQVMIVE